MTPTQLAAGLLRIELEVNECDRKEWLRREGIPFHDSRGYLRHRNPRSWNSKERMEKSDIDAHGCQKDVYEGQCELRKQPFTAVTISKEYDGKHIMDLMNDKKGWTIKEAKMVIENEGGSIDSQWIIHCKK